jgi:hypothetical protein
VAIADNSSWIVYRPHLTVAQNGENTVSVCVFVSVWCGVVWCGCVPVIIEINLLAWQHCLGSDDQM